jgi:hypothetical protein
MSGLFHPLQSRLEFTPSGVSMASGGTRVAVRYHDDRRPRTARLTVTLQQPTRTASGRRTVGANAYHSDRVLVYCCSGRTGLAILAVQSWLGLFYPSGILGLLLLILLVLALTARP